MNTTFWVGVGIVIIGIILAVWLGGWIFFIGGIVQIIESVKADPVSGWGILMGFVRWSLCWVAFWVTLFPVVGTGIGLIKSS